jgi:adenylate kinase
VEAVIARGDLVTDELTIPIVRDRLSEIATKMSAGELGGVLFDGFPRTEPQAVALDEILESLGHELTAVIEISVPRETLIDRMAARRVCETCGTVYQLHSNPPETEGVCDKDHGKLVQRDDDKPESIARRLEHYDTQTSPLLDYYGQRGLVHRVNGDQPVERVEAEIDNALSQVGVA